MLYQLSYARKCRKPGFGSEKIEEVGQKWI